MSGRLLVGTTAAAAVVIALLVATGLGWIGGGASAPGSAFTVRTQLSPVAASYGDAVTATVSLSGTPAALRGVSPTPSFAPYAPIGAAVVTRTTAGPRQTAVYRYTLQCLTDACLPVAGKARQIVFPSFTVAHTKATWPALLVSSGLTPDELASPKLPVRTAFVPSPGYGVSTTLGVLLTAASGLLVLAAAVLAFLELAKLARTRRERRPRLSGLELALAYARDAAARPNPDDRRRAAELLAETLRPDAPELADAAGAVAWSDEPPTPEQTLDLIAAVEERA